MKNILAVLFLIFISANLSAFKMNNPVNSNSVELKDRHFKDRVIAVVNGSTITINKFDLVRVKGAIGSNKGIELVGDNYQASTCYGMVMDNLQPGQTGTVQISGVIKGMDTSGYEYNQELYLSSERGKITTEKKKIGIGTVIKVDPTDGWIILDIYRK